MHASLDQIVSKQMAHAETIRNDSPRTFDESSLEVWTGTEQGDLYIIRIASLPASAKPRQDRQLAEGNTRGSRHVLSVGECFDAVPQEVADLLNKHVMNANVQDRYIGPVFRTREGVATIEHPEHGDHRYEGDMTCVVVYQRALDAEEREARVAD